MAQEIMLQSKVTQVPITRHAVVYPRAITQDFFPTLMHIQAPRPGMSTEADENEVQQIKEKLKPINRREVPELRVGDSAIMPRAGKRFTANPFAGIPNDNDMAISNDGKIISVINSNAYFYDSTGKELKKMSLGEFFKPLNLTHSKYDPRALYDPEADRFIVACLNGVNDSTSYILFAFSQTNDPLQGWNLYAVPGEPLKDTTWSDYPILSLTKDELFLTINSLQNNKTWQLGFRQSFIWQMNKWNGFNGAATLETQLHSDIKYNGRPLRNICPVQGGSKLTGPESYFVSNRNFAISSDTFFLLKLSGTMKQNPKLSMQVIKASGKYGVAPDAKEPNDLLQTNDARILDALLENNVLHCVGNSINPLNGKATVFHGIISDVTAKTPQMRVSILNHPYLEFGYPGIAYAGRNSYEDDVVIFVNHTADTVFPGNSAIYYTEGRYSAPLRLRNGYSRISVIGGADRWGDYCGTQLKYNQPGHVWVAGTYGYFVNGGIGNQFYGYGTSVSEVQNPSEIRTAPETEELTLYPNPSTSWQEVSVDFTLKKEAHLNYSLYDMAGRKLAELMNETTAPGKSRFTFSTGPLSPGHYILLIREGKEVKFRRKFSVL